MNGQTIAHYRITDQIGKGGMGEVYRATDTKLNRDVAIKVLPDLFAKDPDRMARFSREAQVLASLNHPNIAAIHGLEESEGKRALVMELVDGETLQERIKRGPIPVEEALGIAKQIAEALEEAHEHGFIHRDLKPANIKITSNGTVKVLDFGLAKALEGEGGSGSSPDLSQSPTLSAAATAAGVIMGTAAYMSPEQARGQKVDRRADIWSFGVVLYEMLTGKSVYAGETVSDVLAKVLEREPDWDSLPKDTPASTERLLRRCFEKNVRQRLQSMGDARIVIDGYLSNPAGESAMTAGPAAATTRPLWLRLLPWALFGAAALAALLVALSPGAAPEPPLKLNVEVGTEPIWNILGSSVILSPDGTRIAYVVGDDNQREVRVRSLDQLEGTTVAAANSPYHPFFSPDGQWIGYVTPSEMQKVPLTGGTAMTLCEVERSRGASWGPDDMIVFAPSPNSPLLRVPAAGGEPEPLTTLDESQGEVSHRWPQVLPGGEAVLFTSHSQAAGGYDNANVEVLVVETGERKVLRRGGSYGRYVPSGHLVYVNQSTLFAMPFDLGKLEVTGSPAPVVQDVSWDVAHGGAQFSVSETGRLAYIAGDNTVPEYPLAWVEHNGGSAPLWDERGSYGNPRLSPDGKRLSLTVLREGNWDIWVYDLERGVSTRLTFAEGLDTEQIWSPDGEYVVFSSDRHGGAENLYRKRADGSGELERLTEGETDQWASSWSPDGRHITYMSAENGFDVWVLPLDGDRQPELFLGTPFRESSGAFSPDGRWLAYVSNESDRLEVYVRPFPPRGGKWQVSDGGGDFPRWSRDGRQLFYRTDEGMMLASVETAGDTFRAGKPRILFEGAFRGGIGGVGFAGNSFADYDVTADGQRFVMFPAAEASGLAEHPHVTLVTHWFDDLRRTFSTSN